MQLTKWLPSAHEGPRAHPELARDDEVTALARNPDAITVKHDRLRVARGEARDAESLERALAGQDAVVSAFGPRSLKKDDLQEVFVRNLLAAMERPA